MKNKLKQLTSVMVLANGILAHAEVAAFKTEAAKGEVSFKAIGKPAFLKIEGKGEGPEGKIQIDGKKMSGTMTLSLKNLSTGIDLRDEHMKEKYLKVNENPNAVLAFKEIELSEVFDGTRTTLGGTKLKGNLTLNGVTKPIDADLESKKSGNAFDVTSSFKVKLSEFNIAIPEYAGITVADEVSIEVKTQLLPLVATPSMAR